MNIEAYNQGFIVKLAESITEVLAPTNNTQQNWRYARGQDWLKLHAGNAIHHFKFPVEESDDFAVTKHEHEVTDNWDEGATRKGRAQLHKSDPGMMYVTLHDGLRNPTYKLQQHYENTWKVVPKKPKTKKAFLGGLLNKTVDLALTPGAIQPWWARAGLGAGAGALYHIGRQKFYNTEAENAEENSDNRTLLRRILLPGVGLPVVGGLQRSLFNEGKPGNPGYYEKREMGQGAKYF